MGVLVGLVAGLGLLLIVLSGEPVRPGRTAPGWVARARVLLAQAGVEQVSPAQLAAASAGLAVVCGLLVLVLTEVFALALLAVGAAGVLPVAVLRRRARQRRGVLREVWPDVVDNLTSAVRAGLSLPEAVAGIGVRGPVELRAAFTRFGEDFRATGSFGASLDRLELALADPVADRVCETLRLAREVGGSDLGTVLRTLSAFLREDARTRAELEVRQGWTVNAARLAVAAPWIVLLLLATGSSAAVTAYNRPAGVIVLGIGAGMSAVAYQVMRYVARLPEDPRVLGRDTGR